MEVKYIGGMQYNPITGFRQILKVGRTYEVIGIDAGHFNNFFLRGFSGSFEKNWFEIQKADEVLAGSVLPVEGMNFKKYYTLDKKGNMKVNYRNSPTIEMVNKIGDNMYHVKLDGQLFTYLLLEKTMY